MLDPFKSAHPVKHVQEFIADKNSLGTGLKEQVYMDPLNLTVTHRLTGTATSTKLPELFRGFNILFDSQVSFSTWASGKG